jgi:hypothetical protein
MTRGDPAVTGGIDRPAPRFGRRKFLVRASAVGAGAALSGVLPGAARASITPSTKLVRVYKLSTYKMQVCQACKGHGAHKLFRTRHVRRAHAGCNCRVVKVKIPDTQWVDSFVRKNGTLRKVWDDRW